MELYLDSVDFKEIEAALDYGFVKGLTTTPTFMHRHGITDIDGAIVKRAAVHLLKPLKHDAFALRIGDWQGCGLFQRADLQGKARPHVQESKQFDVYFVNLFAPMFYVHGSWLRAKIKSQPRLFRIAAGFV